MQPTDTVAASSEIAATLSPDFGDESEAVQATYDSTRDPTSLAVVAMVATALGDDPNALTPLQTVIDTDALNKLTDPSTGTCDRISFRYQGFEVTVTSDESIEAVPVESR